MSKDIKAKDLSYKAAQSVVEHGSIPLATLKEAISMQEKMDELLAKEIEFPEQEPFPEIPSFPEEVSISNLPDIQKVEVINPSDFSGLQKAIESIEMPKHGELIEESNAVLGAILEALQAEEKGSEKVEVTNLSEVVASLEKIEDTIKKIPEADYKALAKIVKDNLNINVSGGSNGIIRNKGDQQINPATEEKQNEMISAISTKYTLRLAESGVYTYIGEAEIGSSNSNPVWRIKRLDETSGIVILWADGNENFDNVWNDYLTLTYL